MKVTLEEERIENYVREGARTETGRCVHSVVEKLALENKRVCQKQKEAFMKIYGRRKNVK